VPQQRRRRRRASGRRRAAPPPAQQQRERRHTRRVALRRRTRRRVSEPPCGPCERGCGCTFPLAQLLAHEAVCADQQHAAAAAAPHAGPADAACPWCGAAFTLAALTLHAPSCERLPERFASGALPLALAPSHAHDGAALTPAQAVALAHVNARAAPAAAAALPELLTRAAALGFSAAEVQARAGRDHGRRRCLGPRGGARLTPVAPACLAPH
jgi:hypothetical protein